MRFDIIHYVDVPVQYKHKTKKGITVTKVDCLFFCGEKLCRVYGDVSYKRGKILTLNGYGRISVVNHLYYDGHICDIVSSFLTLKFLC